ncbi:ATP phosphoribosyltransferas [Candidatus Scalindua japonica]|uniref:ATP phosphoribosyltransferas n=1 Tax=Candidatus Scalindua japonica TaxID=1284222 RepID=A0A286TXM4_9BACT|nr:hypothetical protein [Candidatus Scalindua japonica]GAX60626.1 ATP phosphoribosyltransferas [Candidatus Scalindua japonica]
MRKSAIVFIILFLFPFCLFADDAGLSRFYQEYSEVSHALMSDQGCVNELTELHSLDVDAADKIADFWLYKSRRECHDFVEKIKAGIDFRDLYKEIDFYIDKKTTPVSGGKYEEVEKKAQKEAEQCRYCIYYENWDAINKMISDKLKVVKEGNKKKEK